MCKFGFVTQSRRNIWTDFEEICYGDSLKLKEEHREIDFLS